MRSYSKHPQFDCVFIAGGHSSECVRAALLHFKRLARSDAFIIMDDVISEGRETGSTLAWRELTTEETRIVEQIGCRYGMAWGRYVGNSADSAKDTPPLQGWCRCCGPGNAAATGHEGYCKICYKQKFRRKYEDKQKRRLKSCWICGKTRELIRGVCKPCGRQRICTI